MRPQQNIPQRNKQNYTFICYIMNKFELNSTDEPSPRPTPTSLHQRDQSPHLLSTVCRFYVWVETPSMNPRPLTSSHRNFLSHRLHGILSLPSELNKKATNKSTSCKVAFNCFFCIQNFVNYICTCIACLTLLLSPAPTSADQQPPFNNNKKEEK